MHGTEQEKQMLTRIAFAAASIAMLAYAEAASHEEEEVCCSKKYAALKDEPCDEDHYCTFIDPKAFKSMQTAGVVGFIVIAAMAVSPC